jgi:hypothetical protein
VGLLLGDGPLYQRYSKGNCRFVFGQSALRIPHISYFNHVYSIFKQYCATDFSCSAAKLKIWIDKRTNTEYQSSGFTTLSLACFNPFKDYFYLEGKKSTSKHRRILNI